MLVDDDWWMFWVSLVGDHFHVKIRYKSGVYLPRYASEDVIHETRQIQRHNTR